jgi:murein DD-endopeptidase / murein LD-carboxypeptidase
MKSRVLPSLVDFDLRPPKIFLPLTLQWNFVYNNIVILKHMKFNPEKTATITKKQLLLYVGAIFIALNVAANVGGKADASNTERFAENSSLQEKIDAFIKAGVEKEINTDHYDREAIIAYAESLIGTPHAMGGYSSAALDCSGLVKLAHAQFQVDLPRSSHDQARYGSLISADEELKRGDLVFFHSTYKKPHLITHTGIYLGDNKFIHASTKRGVTISVLRDSGYYERHYLFATRLDE